MAPLIHHDVVVDIEVDVVIPTLVWDYIEETLDSIDAQLGVTARPIIVNDSGEPAPPTIEARARIVNTPGRIGEGPARAFGFEYVTSRLVAFCDHDDTWMPNKLALQIDALGEEPGWCLTGAERVDGSGVWLEDWPLTTVSELLRTGELERRLLSHNPIPAGPSSILVDSELLASVGGWNLELQYFADWDCFIRLMSAVEPTLVEETLVRYRVWPGQMISDRRRGWVALDAIRTANAQRRRELGVGALDDRVILWILRGELARPDRRLPGLLAAVKRARPQSLSDMRALPMYVRELSNRMFT